jgi:hypothetical protein
LSLSEPISVRNEQNPHLHPLRVQNFSRR